MKSKKITNILAILALFSCIIAIILAIMPLNIPNEPLSISGVHGNISKNDIFNQQINIESCNTKDIVFRLATYGSMIKNVEFNVKLIDDNGETIAYKKYSYPELYDGKYIDFEIPKKYKNLSGIYNFSIEFTNLEEGKNLGIYLHEIVDDDSAELEFNNSNLDGIALYTFINGFNKSYYWYKWATIISAIVFFALFFYQAKLKRVNIFSNLKIKIPIYFGISGFLTVLMLLLIKYSNVPLYGSLFRLNFLIILYFMIWIIANCIRNEKCSVDKLFLLIAIPLGMMYCTYVLPFEVPDSQYHYTSAYQALNLNYYNKNKKIMVPAVIRDNYYQRNKNYHEYAMLIKKDYDYTDLKEFDRDRYNPIDYLFVSCGLAIGKMVNVSPYIGVFIAKLLQYISFIFIGFLIIRISPYGKKLLLVYMLSPMFLQQATSISVDAMINIFSLLFISKVLQIKSSKDENISYCDILVLTLSLLFASVEKLCYLPLGLLVFIFFPKLKKMDKKKWIFISSCIVLLLAAILGWFLCSESVIVSSTANTFSNTTYLIRNPFNSLYLLINDLTVNSGKYINQSIGSLILWREISTPVFYLMLYIIILLFSVYNDNCERKIFDTIAFCITFAICAFMVELALYIIWSPIGGLNIEGIQGRYFIPINILLLLSIIPKKRMINVSQEMSYILVSLSLIAINIKTLLLILNYFI